MKVRLIKNHKVEEPIVTVHYKKMSMSIQAILRCARAQGLSFLGEKDGRTSRIQVEEIFYFESVDQKVFFYTQDQVYRTNLKLYQILSEVKELDFQQISKSCILNMNVLVSIQALKNSRLEALLENGERVHVSRTYIPRIKHFFGIGRGNK